MRLNNVILTKGSAKCHHMVNGGSQSSIVSCVYRMFMTTAWQSSALHFQIHWIWLSRQRGPAKPLTLERFVICHKCVRSELMCLALWKTSTEGGWRGGDDRGTGLLWVSVIQQMDSIRLDDVHIPL